MSMTMHMYFHAVLFNSRPLVFHTV